MNSPGTALPLATPEQARTVASELALLTSLSDGNKPDLNPARQASFYSGTTYELPPTVAQEFEPMDADGMRPVELGAYKFDATQYFDGHGNPQITDNIGSLSFSGKEDAATGRTRHVHYSLSSEDGASIDIKRQITDSLPQPENDLGHIAVSTTTDTDQQLSVLSEISKLHRRSEEDTQFEQLMGTDQVTGKEADELVVYLKLEHSVAASRQKH